MRHPYKPSANRSKAKKQLRKASLDPVRLDELLGQPSVNQIQAEVCKAQRAERHAALTKELPMSKHPKGADSEVA